MFQNLVQKVYAGDTLWPGEGNAPSSAIGDYKTLMQAILDNILNPLITLMVGVAVIYFLYGVFVFIQNADSPAERKKGGMHIMYSSLGLFLMVAAYGVLNLILGTVKPN